MPRYEGILVTWNSHVNTSAAGADIDKDKIELEIYSPSDTARNLHATPSFTFSLVNDPTLFYKASLTGSNEPGFSELPENAVEERSGYYYPKDASVVHLCEVKEYSKHEIQDEFGKSVVFEVKGEVTKKIGKGEFIQRENPLVEAMVHATRLSLLEGKRKEKLRGKIYKTLENQNDELSKKILEYVEGS